MQTSKPIKLYPGDIKLKKKQIGEHITTIYIDREMNTKRPGDVIRFDEWLAEEPQSRDFITVKRSAGGTGSYLEQETFNAFFKEWDKIDWYQ